MMDINNQFSSNKAIIYPANYNGYQSINGENDSHHRPSSSSSDLLSYHHQQQQSQHFYQNDDEQTRKTMDNMTFLSNEHDIDDDDNVDDEQQQQIYPTTMVIISANTLHPQTLPVIDDGKFFWFCFVHSIYRMMTMIIYFFFTTHITDLQEKGVHLTIIEEPINRIRYRYRSEKGSHGGLNGVNSCPIRKTYPTVKVVIATHIQIGILFENFFFFLFQRPQQQQQ